MSSTQTANKIIKSAFSSFDGNIYLAYCSKYVCGVLSQSPGRNRWVSDLYLNEGAITCDFLPSHRLLAYVTKSANSTVMLYSVQHESCLASLQFPSEVNFLQFSNEFLVVRTSLQIHFILLDDLRTRQTLDASLQSKVPTPIALSNNSTNLVAAWLHSTSSLVVRELFTTKEDSPGSIIAAQTLGAKIDRFTLSSDGYYLAIVWTTQKSSMLSVYLLGPKASPRHLHNSQVSGAVCCLHIYTHAGAPRLAVVTADCQLMIYPIKDAGDKKDVKPILAGKLDSFKTAPPQKSNLQSSSIHSPFIDVFEDETGSYGTDLQRQIKKDFSGDSRNVWMGSSDSYLLFVFPSGVCMTVEHGLGGCHVYNTSPCTVPHTKAAARDTPASSLRDALASSPLTSHAAPQADVKTQLAQPQDEEFIEEMEDEEENSDDSVRTFSSSDSQYV